MVKMRSARGKRDEEMLKEERWYYLWTNLLYIQLEKGEGFNESNDGDKIE